MNKKGFNWHNLLMLVCLIPIGVVVFNLFKDSSQVKNFSSSNLLWLGMLILCPLMHLFMMRGMNHGNSCHKGENEEAQGSNYQNQKD